MDPDQRRTKLRGASSIESLDNDTKWRADVGGVFPYEGSIRRIVDAVVSKRNDEWTTQRHDMQVGAVAEIETGELEPIRGATSQGLVIPPGDLAIPTPLADVISGK